MTNKQKAEAVDSCCNELFAWYVDFRPKSYNTLKIGFTQGTYTIEVDNKVNELSAKHGISSNLIKKIVTNYEQ